LIRTLENKKLLSLFPNYKFTPFEKGIEQTVNWFIENYDNIGK
jgi:GDP-L-fucose synthase